ncbi:MAG TPA: iron ABC transporter permease [Anaerolineaceae bacterium]|nr:iron ABC transporter permease [Anaerolineaceae bacterium]
MVPIRSALRQQGWLWLWLLPLAFLSFFFFRPLLAIFRLAFEGALAEGLSFDAWARLGQPLLFTIWQAGLSTLLTLLVGLPAAWVFARFSFPGKKLISTLSTLPFILPTVVAAAGFNALLGPRGWINLLLMDWFNLTSPPVQFLNSLGAILLAHVFYNTTVVLRVVGSAWAQLDTRLEQAARSLGASPLRTFWEVTAPLLRPPLAAAALLIFLFDFTSFGVILLLGGPQYATLEVEIYIQALHLLNLPLAGLLSAVQLAATLALTALYSRLVRGRNIPLTPRLSGEGQRRPRGWRERLVVVVTATSLVLLFVLPLLALASRSITRLEADRGQRGAIQTGLTLDYYRELFINRRGAFFYVPPVEAARNSLSYAGLTVLISLGLGFLAARALAHRSKLNAVLDPLLMLPLGASAVTLGLGFIVVFNRPPWDVGSFPLLIPLAHSLVALPFVVRTLYPALAAIPPELRQAAAVLGAPAWRVWLEVDLPIVARAAAASAVFAFTISLGEFGATTFLARPETPTLPVAVYRFLSQPGAMNYGQALAMATLLMLLCATAVLILERLEKVLGSTPSQ